MPFLLKIAKTNKYLLLQTLYDIQIPLEVMKKINIQTHLFDNCAEDGIRQLSNFVFSIRGQGRNLVEE